MKTTAKPNMSGSTLGRRAQYAAETKLAILSAGRRLFLQKGYFNTTVEEIAALANVAAITVYSSVGGKASLLALLMDSWSQDSITDQTLANINLLDNAEDILQAVANSSSLMREEFGDIIATALFTAPHDESVAKSLKVATTRQRRALQAVAERLIQVGGLRKGVTLTAITDTLWFYFGYWGAYSLHQDNGWSYKASYEWLLANAKMSLLSSMPSKATVRK